MVPSVLVVIKIRDQLNPVGLMAATARGANPGMSKLNPRGGNPVIAWNNLLLHLQIDCRTHSYEIVTIQRGKRWGGGSIGKPQGTPTLFWDLSYSAWSCSFGV